MFFLIFGPWTPKFLGFDPKIGFCMKFPPWGQVLRRKFFDSGPKMFKNQKHKKKKYKMPKG